MEYNTAIRESLVKEPPNEMSLIHAVTQITPERA